MLQLIYSNAQLFVTLLFSSFDKVSTNFVANAVTFVLGFNSVLGVPSRLNSWLFAHCVSKPAPSAFGKKEWVVSLCPLRYSVKLTGMYYHKIDGQIASRSFHVHAFLKIWYRAFFTSFKTEMGCHTYWPGQQWFSDDFYCHSEYNIAFGLRETSQF